MKRAVDAAAYLEKAGRTLSAAQLLLSGGDTEGSCNRAYYAMFYAANAALLCAGVDAPEVGYRTHNGLIAAFGKHVVIGAGMDPKIGRAINRVERFRQLADYIGDPPSLADATSAVEHAVVFVEAIRARFAADTPSSGL